MASSDNLATIEPWMFRSTIADSWYPDAFAKETESALTRALQQSLFNNHQQSEIVSAANHSMSSSFMMKQNDYSSTTTPSASTVTASGSGSEPETPGSKRRGAGGNLGVAIGKSTKRKSRASKRSMTTFIQADPANFRQMVQQVTGVKIQGNGQLPGSSLMKPEPLRQPFINKLQGLLPTLDTSAYLLDHQSNNKYTSATTGFSQPPAMNLAADNGGAGMDFYSFCSFPTLESSI